MCFSYATAAMPKRLAIAVLLSKSALIDFKSACQLVFSSSVVLFNSVFKGHNHGHTQRSQNGGHALLLGILATARS